MFFYLIILCINLAHGLRTVIELSKSDISLVAHSAACSYPDNFGTLKCQNFRQDLTNLNFTTKHMRFGDNFVATIHQNFDTNLTVVAFTGTKDLDGWKTNIEIQPTLFMNKIRVHSGFAKRANLFYHLIEPVLNDTVDRGHEVILTGHSLGGALAVVEAFRSMTLASTRLLSNQIKVITFGSPHVFYMYRHNQFPDNWAKNHLRFYNPMDAVPYSMKMVGCKVCELGYAAKVKSVTSSTVAIKWALFGNLFRAASYSHKCDLYVDEAIDHAMKSFEYEDSCIKKYEDYDSEYDSE